VWVYLIDGESVRWINPNAEVIKAFGKYFTCDIPQEANVGAVAWIEESEKLLLVAVKYPLIRIVLKWGNWGGTSSKSRQGG
jgi:hypothetical protein